nr:hypothetical protein [Sicyoidochytrium minutum DNA virus]
MAYEPSVAELSAANDYLAYEGNAGEFSEKSTFAEAYTPEAFAALNVREASPSSRTGKAVVMVGRRGDFTSNSVMAMTTKQLAEFLSGDVVERDEGEDYAPNSVSLPWWITIPAGLMLIVGIVFVSLFAAGTIALDDYKFMGITGATLLTLGNLLIVFKIFHYPILIVIGFILAIIGLVLWAIALANRA